MSRDSRVEFLAMLDKVSPTLRRAFEEAVQDIRSSAQLRLVEDAIQRGDVEAAMRALQLGSEFFAPLDRAISEAFYQGGVYQMSRLPKAPSTGSQGPVVLRFNTRTLRAETWVREKSSGLITEIVEGQRTAVRETIMAGLERGRGPRAIARDIVGRTEGNRRVGGILGLHSQHAAYVRAARDELSDPELMGRYFDRKRRDRRFDAAIRRAAREGKRLSETDIGKIARRYADRLLGLRGEMIARTETIAALNAGRIEGLQQMVDRGAVTAAQVSIEWDSTADGRTRPDHLFMEGQTVQLGQPFQAPDGSLLYFPGDTSLGASASQTVGCRCYARPRIDFLAAAT